MSSRRRERNFAASVHQRLLNLAHERGLNFNRLLQRYAIERFLYRLAASDEVDQYTLKGAALFRVWTERELRPTKDVDFLATEPDDHAGIRAAMAGICGVSCPEDGVAFSATDLKVADIRPDLHGGKRVLVQGRLGTARLPLQVDIGFGDVITPEREKQDYPTLLDLPAPRLWTYPRETVVAEKFDAMVSRGVTNSRMKDFWDIACLARVFSFSGKILQAAIIATMRQRGTKLDDRPLALSTSYYLDATRQQRWLHQQRRSGVMGDGPTEFPDAGDELRRFLGPVCDSVIAARPFTDVWPPGGPWQPPN